MKIYEKYKTVVVVLDDYATSFHKEDLSVALNKDKGAILLYATHSGKSVAVIKETDSIELVDNKGTTLDPKSPEAMALVLATFMEIVTPTEARSKKKVVDAAGDPRLRFGDSGASIVWKEGNAYLSGGKKDVKILTEKSLPLAVKSIKEDLKEVRKNSEDRHSHKNKDVLDRIKSGGDPSRVLSETGGYVKLPSGVNRHSDLKGSDEKDLHPIKSVIGLAKALLGKADKDHSHDLNDLVGKTRPGEFLVKNEDGSFSGSSIPEAGPDRVGGVKIRFDKKTGTLYINAK